MLFTFLSCIISCIYCQRPPSLDNVEQPLGSSMDVMKPRGRSPLRKNPNPLFFSYSLSDFREEISIHYMRFLMPLITTLSDFLFQRGDFVFVVHARYIQNRYDPTLMLKSHIRKQFVRITQYFLDGTSWEISEFLKKGSFFFFLNGKKKKKAISKFQTNHILGERV